MYEERYLEQDVRCKYRALTATCFLPAHTQAAYSEKASIKSF